MAPSLLLVKQTYRRILNLKAGFKGITFLPITVGSLMIFVYFIFGYLSQFPFFNLSWLGYNIALGPYADLLINKQTIFSQVCRQYQIPTLLDPNKSTKG